ncbi:NifB/NifX family molybdenum-iron cluster-binding protein [Mycoplasma sp. P36-A1]|uniref:NifB/NifX family molybdenum-iron cluster-binding protein n=1 Tax=Mycoplasma sp. P36-A1 TaxID=3252900 RepID=UPI003C2EEE62
MKIAMPYEDGKIFQHYGKSKQVIIYTIEEGKVLAEEVITLDLKPEQSIANVLKQNGVSTIVVGHLGQGAIDSIEKEGLDIIRGIDLDTATVAQMYADGSLKSNNQDVCDHDHDHSHNHH